MKKPFVIEVETAEEANNVDLEQYRLSEQMSAKKGIYVFLRRRSAK